MPNCLIMPYSYLSVIQHYQADAYDKQLPNFYTEDYYKLDGETQLHKFMYNTLLLERLIDDYWCQNRDDMTTLLVKKEEIERYE